MLTIFETNILMEDRYTSYAIAGLTGLVGGAPGSINAMYNNQKVQAATQDLEFKKSGEYKLYKTDRTGSGLIFSLIGAIPVVGAVTNIMLAKQRWDALDEQDKTDSNAKKIIASSKLKIRDKEK